MQNKELHAELQCQQLYNHEIVRKVKKNDRKFKDLADAADEEKAAKAKLESTIDELNCKVRSLRTQLEETEKSAAGQLAKYRKVQLDLESAKTRADFAENQLSNQRLRTRLSVQRDGLAGIDENKYDHDYSRSSLTPSRTYGRASMTVRMSALGFFEK